jgi:hypothetical protein
MRKFIATALLGLCGLVSAPTQSAVICAGCEYGSGAGSFLGGFNAITRDLATFTHTGVGGGPFEDFWVFDVRPNAVMSVSADFTALAPIFGFFGELFQDDGSVCVGFDCSSIALGEALGRTDASGRRFELDDGEIAFLPPGRYVLHIGGVGNPFNGGAYSGQMAFFGVAIREAGTLGLFGLGLFALGVAWRRYQR